MEQISLINLMLANQRKLVIEEDRLSQHQRPEPASFLLPMVKKLKKVNHSVPHPEENLISMRSLHEVHQEDQASSPVSANFDNARLKSIS